MSKQLLQNVGEFFYGQEWQAPLARDLRVNERSMRRWLAGTENIPQGIWTDLSSKLKIYQNGLGILVNAVNTAASLIEVHAFKVWDSRQGDMVQARGKSTAARIKLIDGEIIPGSAEWLPPTRIDPEGRMILESHQKELRTAKEIGDMILAKLGVAGVHIDVHRDTVYGWHPTVYTTPERAVGTQRVAESIASELRVVYDISDEDPPIGRPLNAFVAHEPRKV
jgi:hypothetical protein